eukprot:EG_transcript_17076
MAATRPQLPGLLLCALLFRGKVSAKCDWSNPCYINGQCVSSDQCPSVNNWSRALIWFPIGIGVLLCAVAVLLVLCYWKRRRRLAGQQLRQIQIGQPQQPIAGVALAVVPTNTPDPREAQHTQPASLQKEESYRCLPDPHPHPENNANVPLDDGPFGPLVDVATGTPVEDPGPTGSVRPPAEPVSRAPSRCRA